MCRTSDKIFLHDKDFNTNVDKFVEKDSARELTSLASTDSPVCTISVQLRCADEEKERATVRRKNSVQRDSAPTKIVRRTPRERATETARSAIQIT